MRKKGKNFKKCFCTDDEDEFFTNTKLHGCLSNEEEDTTLWLRYVHECPVPTISLIIQLYLQKCKKKKKILFYPSCQSHACSPGMARCSRKLAKHIMLKNDNNLMAVWRLKNNNFMFLFLFCFCCCLSAQDHNKDCQVQYSHSAKAKHSSKLMLNLNM